MAEAILMQEGEPPADSVPVTPTIAVQCPRRAAIGVALCHEVPHIDRTLHCAGRHQHVLSRLGRGVHTGSRPHIIAISLKPDLPRGVTKGR